MQVASVCMTDEMSVPEITQSLQKLLNLIYNTNFKLYIYLVKVLIVVSSTSV